MHNVLKQYYIILNICNLELNKIQRFIKKNLWSAFKKSVIQEGVIK